MNLLKIIPATLGRFRSSAGTVASQLHEVISKTFRNGALSQQLHHNGVSIHTISQISAAGQKRHDWNASLYARLLPANTFLQLKLFFARNQFLVV
ncbi:MAG: hypothetical protein ACYC6O_09640 [Thermoleophilia bacterium]